MTQTPSPSPEDVRAKWQPEAEQESTSELVHILRLLAGAQQPTPHEDLVIEIITSTLLARHPEVAAAHQRWEAVPLRYQRSEEVIAAAVRSLGPRFAWLDNGSLATGTLGEYGLLWHYRQHREHGEISPVIKTWDGQTLDVAVDNPDEDLHLFTAGPHTYQERFMHYAMNQLRPQDERCFPSTDATGLRATGHDQITTSPRSGAHSTAECLDLGRQEQTCAGAVGRRGDSAHRCAARRLACPDPAIR
ncbi:hypothetical protein [Nocardia sp. NPDC050710]|uniref:hypothetical protein n=1 Tax=Nocardia sp. NPDC050710 TaxID=3157220 RepID=UPI0033FED9FD